MSAIPKSSLGTIEQQDVVHPPVQGHYYSNFKVTGSNAVIGDHHDHSHTCNAQFLANEHGTIHITQNYYYREAWRGLVSAPHQKKPDDDGRTKFSQESDTSAFAETPQRISTVPNHTFIRFYVAYGTLQLRTDFYCHYVHRIVPLAPRRGPREPDQAQCTACGLKIYWNIWMGEYIRIAASRLADTRRHEFVGWCVSRGQIRPVYLCYVAGVRDPRYCRNPWRCFYCGDDWKRTSTADDDIRRVAAGRSHEYVGTNRLSKEKLLLVCYNTGSAYPTSCRHGELCPGCNGRWWEESNIIMEMDWYARRKVSEENAM